MKAQSDGLFSFSPFLFFFFIFFSYRCKYEIFAPPENSLRSIKMWNNLVPPVPPTHSPNATKKARKKYNSIESKYTIKLQTIYIFKGPVSNMDTMCTTCMTVLQSRELVTSLVKGWILKTWLETSLVFLSMRMEFPR